MQQPRILRFSSKPKAAKLVLEQRPNIRTGLMEDLVLVEGADYGMIYWPDFSQLAIDDNFTYPLYRLIKLLNSNAQDQETACNFFPDLFKYFTNDYAVKYIAALNDVENVEQNRSEKEIKDTIKRIFELKKLLDELLAIGYQTNHFSLHPVELPIKLHEGGTLTRETFFTKFPYLYTGEDYLDPKQIKARLEEEKMKLLSLQNDNSYAIAMKLQEVLQNWISELSSNGFIALEHRGRNVDKYRLSNAGVFALVAGTILALIVFRGPISGSVYLNSISKTKIPAIEELKKSTQPPEVLEKGIKELIVSGTIKQDDANQIKIKLGSTSGELASSTFSFSIPLKDNVDEKKAMEEIYQAFSLSSMNLLGKVTIKQAKDNKNIKIAQFTFTNLVIDPKLPQTQSIPVNNQK